MWSRILAVPFASNFLGFVFLTRVIVSYEQRINHSLSCFPLYLSSRNTFSFPSFSTPPCVLRTTQLWLRVFIQSAMIKLYVGAFPRISFMSSLRLNILNYKIGLIMLTSRGSVSVYRLYISTCIHMYRSIRF